MNYMAILGLVWGINLFTPARTRVGFDRLVELVTFIVQESEKHFTKTQVKKIVWTMKLSAEWHQGFYRKDDLTPYIVHPLEVVETLFRLGIYDFMLVISAILHDVVEDEANKDKRYRKRTIISCNLGYTVRETVELVTKSREPWRRKLFFFYLIKQKKPYVAWRGQALKLVDAETNARTYSVFVPEKRREKIDENYREYPAVAKRLDQLLKERVRKGELKSNPYERLAELLLRHLYETLAHYR